MVIPCDKEVVGVFVRFRAPLQLLIVYLPVTVKNSFGWDDIRLILMK
jgi:hypothetical protein